MRWTIRPIHWAWARLAAPLILAVACMPGADGESFTPSSDAPFAWGEAVGWINAAPAGTEPVVITDTVASGFLWSESVGWINLGDGSPDRSAHYSNASAEDFGVNHDGSGGLYGFAWGEAIGWINFNTSSSEGSQVRIEGNGQLSGYAWSESVGWINFNSGYGVLLIATGAEGEGTGEGSVEGTAEGSAEGTTEGTVEGTIEGVVEGVLEGMSEGSLEGTVDGEGQPGTEHSADQDGDYRISLTELLRVIQFFNLRGYYCVTAPATSEDGYLPGAGDNQRCTPHQSDYNPQDWKISLTELLRLIQFFNLRGYHPCPELLTEDGYCPGAG